MNATATYSTKGMVTAVFGRLAETPWYGQVLGLLAGLAATIRSDAFYFIITLLFVSHAIDWWFGRAAAKASGAFDRLKATQGLHSKGAGIALIILIRLFELWLHDFSKQSHTLPSEYVNTGGLIATAVAVFLLTNDMESIMGHREAMGAKPIPVLSGLIGGLRRLFNSLLPKGLQGAGKDRDD